jgi:hypothetical protein
MTTPLTKAFTEHPASVGESYFGHLRSASGFSLRMIAAGLACFVHGLLPFLFVATGRKTVLHLHDVMVENRDKRPVSMDVQKSGKVQNASQS